MRIGITGGAGFLGGYTSRECLARGHEVTVFDRYDKHNLPEGADMFLGDITNPVDVTELVAHVDAWIHLAGVLGSSETISNPSPAAATNILGGLNLFKAAAQYKVPGVNIAVGNHYMNNTYSITKSTMERFAHMFNKEQGTNITIVRALNAYGPRQVSAPPYGPSQVKKIMPAFVNNAIRGLPISIYGKGSQVMDMIYASDVAWSLVNALEYTVANGHHDSIFEAGSGNSTTVNEIANLVNRVAGSDGGLIHIPMRPGEPDHSVVLGRPDTLKPLGLIPSQDFVPLEEGIHRTVKYFRGLM